MAELTGLVLHNGQPAPPTMPMLDPIVVRGDGCFEALRSYAGRLFALDDHLDRLARSAAALGIALPSLEKVGRWASEVASDRGNGVVRIMVSGDSQEANIYVFSAPLGDYADTVTAVPVVAPWHPGGEQWELAGVKTLSYAPNMAAGRVAQAQGFDEALLLSREGVVLEGPTTSFVWVVEGVLETPSLELGILASVTRRVVLGLARQEGWAVREGRFPASRLESASEMALLSTTREILPVTAVGEWKFRPGPVTAQLMEGYRKQVDALAPPDQGQR